nr:lactate utilization protein B [uncultured Carboxylicivirga sp.]
MSNQASIFKRQSAKIASDLKHRKTINFNISKYDVAVQAGKLRFSDFELAKEITADIKNEVINRLPDLLIEFEENAKNNGTEVYWAEDANSLIEQISEVLKIEETKILVKSKSMVSEEVELNEHLEERGIESVETDLGEFIVQVAGEKPYHIVTPAMHKSKTDVAHLFNKHFGTDLNLSAEEMTDFVRHYLRNKFLTADVGITGGNFICAKEGAIAVTENEGNAFLSASMPKTHIVIVGIEKVIPSIDDLTKMWPVLAAHGTGQQLTVYSNVFFGPKKINEKDGPERMIVFLLDNKRSQLYSDPEIRQSLKCIRCGACLNYCPVYKNIGGYTYAATYSGPIGSVISPHFKDFGEYNHLSFASSLCGKCEEVCPVKIPLTKLLLYNRQQASKGSFVNKSMYSVLSDRKKLDLFGGTIKNWMKESFQHKFIGENKDLSDFSSKSFSKQYRKNKKS